MALRDIFQDIASVLGYDIIGSGDIEADPDQVALILARINQVAKELYESTDLIGCLREQVFDLTNTIGSEGAASSQVTFPYYVGEIRGCRYYNSRLKITVNDMQPRYHYGIGKEIWGLRYRVLRKTAFFQDIVNESELKFSMNLPSVEDFNITIIGQTSNSFRTSETIFCKAGEQAWVSANNYINVEVLKRDTITTYDLIVSDIDGNVISVIPNNQLSVEYLVAQVLDTGDTSDAVPIEFLYKERFFPFTDLDSEFPCGDRYDKAIYWKYIEHEESRSRNIEGSLAAQAKCNSIIKQIAEDAEAGVEKEVNIASNPYLDISPFSIGRYSRRMFPYWFR